LLAASGGCGFGLWWRRGLEHPNLRFWRFWRRGLGRRLFFLSYFYYRTGFDFSLGRSLNWLDRLGVFDQTRADLGRELFGKVLLPNAIGDFVRHCIRGHTNVNPFATSILDNFLVIQLQLFCEIVYPYLLMNCCHT
jgi:hypothetical protein